MAPTNSKSTETAKIDDGLVSGHHDGRVRNVLDELRRQTAVDAAYALVRGYLHQRLPEVPVPTAFFAHPRTGNFYNIHNIHNICNNSCNNFYNIHKSCRVPGTFQNCLQKSVWFTAIINALTRWWSGVVVARWS